MVSLITLETPQVPRPGFHGKVGVAEASCQLFWLFYVPYFAVTEYDSLDAREVTDHNSSAGLAGETRAFA